MPLKKMIGAAFFAAIISVLSQFYIPIGAVPHTLQVMAVVLAGVVMGPTYGAVSVIVWILLGLCGLPVFTMGHSGPTVLAGPTGGFIIGFIIQAWLCGFCRVSRIGWIRSAAIALASLAVPYIIGLIGFMTVFAFFLHKTMTWQTAVTACVIPFLPFDIIKVFLGLFIGSRIAKALEKAGLSVTSH